MKQAYVKKETIRRMPQMSLSSIVRTFAAAGHDSFKHMLMAGFLQSIQKAAVDIVRLVHDNVQQLFSCLD